MVKVGTLVLFLTIRVCFPQASYSTSHSPQKRRKLKLHIVQVLPFKEEYFPPVPRLFNN